MQVGDLAIVQLNHLEWVGVIHSIDGNQVKLKVPIFGRFIRMLRSVDDCSLHEDQSIAAKFSNYQDCNYPGAGHEW